MWHIYDLGFNNPESSIALDTPPFPKRFDAHGTFTGAVCNSRQMLARIDQNSVYAAATYVQNRSFRFGAISTGLIASTPMTVTVPLIKDETAGGFVGPLESFYTLRERDTSRATTYRVKRRIFAGGESEAEAFADLIDPNLNRLYTLSGRSYILSGYTMRTYSTNQIVIEYRFWTTGDIPAIPANPSQGWHITVPALNNLCEYDVNLTANPPTIRVSLPEERYAPGGALPGL